MSFISFVCFAASTAAAFITAPLIEFLAALFLLFAYSTKFNERFKGFHWPLVVSFLTYKLHRASDNNICPWKPVVLCSKSPCLLFHQGLPALCQRFHHLFHHLYNVCVKICGWSLKGRWGRLTSVHSNSLLPALSVTALFICELYNMWLAWCLHWFHVSLFFFLFQRSLASLPQYSSRWTFISSSMNWLTSSREVIPVKNHQTHKVSILGSYLHYLHLFALPFKSH